MKPCMELCCMAHLWWRFLLYCHYICVDHGLEGKLMNIWMSGYDDRLMCKLCLVFYFNCESMLFYFCYEHVNFNVKIICRCYHEWIIKDGWPLPMYVYVKVWIAKVRSLEYNVKIVLPPMLNGVVWFMFCCELWS